MSDQPLVTILIPFYNCPYVGQAIQSALKQTYPRTEVIVINDGSTKHTELVNPYRSKIVYLEKENGGVASAINLGISHAKGDYVSWLSSDDLFHLNKVERQVRFMKKKKSFLSFTNFHIIDKNNRITRADAGYPFKNDDEILKVLQRSNPINGCTVMMKKEVFQTIGLFNEKLRFTQDYEFWLRTALKYRLHYLPETLTNYRIHDQMGTVRYRQELMDEFKLVRRQYREKIRERILQLKK